MIDWSFGFTRSQKALLWKLHTLNIGSTLVFSPKNNNDEKYFQFNFIRYFLKLWKFGKFKRKFVLIFQNVSTFPHYSLKIFWPKSVNTIKTIFSHPASLKIYYSKSFFSIQFKLWTDNFEMLRHVIQFLMMWKFK